MLVLITRLADGRPVENSFLIGNLTKFLIGFCIYRFLIFPLYSLIGYMRPHVTLIPLSAEGFSLVLNNISSVFDVLKTSFLPFPSLIVFSLIACLLILTSVIIQSTFSSNGKAILMVRLIFILVAPLVFLLLVPGVSMTLSSPVIAPRTLVGFSMLLIYVFWAFIH